MNTVSHQGTAPDVQCYDDAIPVAEIGRKMCVALNQGDAVVSVVTGTHRRLLDVQLTTHGIDIAAALRNEQYVSVNALNALSNIIVDGAPDVIRFAEVIGALVDRAASRFPRVLIFGELAALIHADGMHAAAIELDRLWRSFTAARPVFLDCACPYVAFQDHRSLSFARRAFAKAMPHSRVETQKGNRVPVAPTAG
jgi:hypothetical protein